MHQCHYEDKTPDTIALRLYDENTGKTLEFSTPWALKNTCLKQ
jgi:hypothetical protein